MFTLSSRPSMAMLFALVSGLAHAEIREARSLREITPHLEERTVLVLDLDNTVFEAAQTLGTDQFFEHLVNLAKSTGTLAPDAVVWALREATPIQPVTRVRPVESITRNWIQAAQDRGIPTVALTARPIEWASGTLEQLKSLQLDFRHSILYRGDGAFGPDGRGRNFQGVLFMPAGGDKGRYLKDFLEASVVSARDLIFVDDKPRNVQSVDSAFAGSYWNHIEFRYGAADERVQSFDPRLADFQWGYFKQHQVFLTDQDAYRKMESETAGSIQ